jgi:hypothetical protein
VINADGLEGGVWPLAKQRDSLKKLGHAVNLVSHGTVRRLVMGTTGLVPIMGVFGSGFGEWSARRR